MNSILQISAALGLIASILKLVLGSIYLKVLEYTEKFQISLPIPGFTSESID